MRQIISLWFIVILVTSVTIPNTQSYDEKTAFAENFPKENSTFKSETKGDRMEIIDEILSWYFWNLNIDKLSMFGKIKTSKGIVGNSLVLDGTDYLVVDNSKEGDKFSTITLSAWVKPNYTTASRELTIISKEKAFDLAIRNYDSNHVVEFSIFDGSKWTYVKSKTSIKEEWTNLIATFDGISVSIYINGKLEASKKI